MNKEEKISTLYEIEQFVNIETNGNYNQEPFRKLFHEILEEEELDLNKDTRKQIVFTSSYEQHMYHISDKEFELLEKLLKTLSLSNESLVSE